MELKDSGNVFNDELKDPEYVINYLTMVLKDNGEESFLAAFEAVAKVLLKEEDIFSLD